MARKLNATVLVGGVVYTAGTEEADVDGYVGDELWDGERGPDSRPAPAPAGAAAAVQAGVTQVDDLREVLEAIAARVIATDELLRAVASQLDIDIPGTDAETKFGQLADATSTGSTGSTGSTAVDYSEWKVPDLKAEVERRNSGRDTDAQVTVEEPGNKPELIAALTADDTDN